MKLTWNKRDAIENGMIENLQLGRVAIVGLNAAGDPLFKLTPKGEAEAQALLLKRGKPKGRS